ncbi:MAG: hypothetical protein ACREF8_02750, partial [Chthoniobacterales bacterium]
LESEKAGKGARGERLVDFAREGVETFARAQKNFLDVVAQQTSKATHAKPEHGKVEHNGKSAKPTEIAQLARDAGNAFIEAQKRILDVIGQQMNVNLDVATRTLEKMSPAQLMPMANLTGEGVKNFVQKETSLIGSLVKPGKKNVARVKHAKHGATHRKVAIEV